MAFSEYLTFNDMYLQVIIQLSQLHFHPLPYWNMSHPQSLTIPKPDNPSNQFIMLNIILILPTMVRFDDFFVRCKDINIFRKIKGAYNLKYVSISSLYFHKKTNSESGNFTIFLIFLLFLLSKQFDWLKNSSKFRIRFP